MNHDQADIQNQEAPQPRADLWRLPEIREVEAVRVRYEEPRQRYVGPNQVREFPEAVEIRIRTSEEFIPRALSPVLYVGDVPIPDFEPAGENLYRFLAFEPEKLREGAPISLGWPDLPATRRQTSYQLHTAEEAR